MRWALAPVPYEFEALCFQCVRNRIGEFKEHFVALHGVDDRRLRTGRARGLNLSGSIWGNASIIAPGREGSQLWWQQRKTLRATPNLRTHLFLLTITVNNKTVAIILRSNYHNDFALSY